MKTFFLHIAFVLISIVGHCQTVSIPDPAFLQYIKDDFSETLNNNDELIISQAALVTSPISCSGLGIKNLEGIQYFTKTKRIIASNNEIVSMPSLLPITTLQTLHIFDNKLTTIPDFKGLVNLKTVLLYGNQLTEMPLFGNNPLMEEIIISKNKLTSIGDLSVVPSLLKLDVGENQLTQLPDLSFNTNLDELICWNNKLTVLPSLTNLVHLRRLNASENKLTETPDLSANTDMRILALNNNFLTEGPNLSAMNGLTSVKLYNNYFSFSDLMPYTTISGFSSKFEIKPMKKIKVDSIDAYLEETVYAGTGIDRSISGVTYNFFENGASIDVVGIDSVSVNQSFSGIRYVYAKLTHPSFPGLMLETDSIVIHFHACPVSSAVTYVATKTDCSNSGTVKVSVQGYVPQTTTYQLTALSQGWIQKYSTNYITGLVDTGYALQIHFSPACILDYSKNIEMPYVDCKEVFMTPNNDGDMDTYFITGTGSGIIYDKNGKEVKRVTLPYEWNGYGPNGLVAAGYYIVVINGGKDKVYISVLY